TSPSTSPSAADTIQARRAQQHRQRQAEQNQTESPANAGLFYWPQLAIRRRINDSGSYFGFDKRHALM
ncbi:hypothetical protein, partial [Rhizobium cauense]|uniref:hypothetical protein n=1 Tax=Rhizobium cauense TaxID=1166683 RepID=UPI001C6DFF54